MLPLWILVFIMLAGQIHQAFLIRNLRGRVEELEDCQRTIAKRTAEGFELILGN